MESDRKGFGVSVHFHEYKVQSEFLNSVLLGARKLLVKVHF